MAIARFTHEVQLAVGIGAPRPIQGVTLSAVERKLIALLHVDEAEWLKNREQRRRGSDFLGRTSLGKKVVERGESRTTGPIFTAGFRER